MSSEPGAVEARQNPRTRRVCQAILATAVEVLLERGVHEVTASRVAARADVARTTVYRHWPDQRSLLLATIDELTAPHGPAQSAGRLDDDVRMVLEQLRTRLTTHDVRSVFGAFATRSAHDEVFSDAQRRFVEQLTQPTVDVLEGAQQRGELDADVDCAFEATFLAGPVLHRYLALQQDPTDALIEETIRRWFASNNLVCDPTTR